MGPKELWIKIIEEMSKELAHAQIITWFKNTAILSIENGTMKVGLPLPFFLGWHQTHYAKKTLETAKAIDPSINEVEYTVDIALTDGSPLVVDLIKHFPKASVPRKLPNNEKVKMIGKRYIAGICANSNKNDPSEKLALF